MYSNKKGSIDLETLSYTRKEAIKKCCDSFDNKYTWKQLSDYGRKAVKVYLTFNTKKEK